MVLNEQKGNMYGFVTHTWNAIKGECSHNCSYCYMKRWGGQRPVRLDEKELKVDLGENNFIFVGSSTDMFAEGVPNDWIIRTLQHCKKFNNTYLFQTKNPKRFLKFVDNFPVNTILGTTIETDSEELIHDFSNSPPVYKRSKYMSDKLLWRFRRMVTIEPVIDFHTTRISELIEDIRPEFVNLGADSTGNKLPEPTPFKIECLIKELRKFTKVNLKPNLSRIYKENGNII